MLNTLLYCKSPCVLMTGQKMCISGDEILIHNELVLLCVRGRNEHDDPYTLE